MTNSLTEVPVQTLGFDAPCSCSAFAEEHWSKMYSMAVGLDIPFRRLPNPVISCELLVLFVDILCISQSNTAVSKRLCWLSVL